MGNDISQPSRTSAGIRRPMQAGRGAVTPRLPGYYFDRQKPERIRLHLVRDEALLAG